MEVIMKQKSNLIRTKIVRTGTLVFVLLFACSTMSHAQNCQKSKEQASLSKKLTQLSWDANLEQIKIVIDENPELVNHRLKNDETFLTIAAWQGNKEIAEYVIGNGINVGLRNKWNNDALHNAAIKGYDDIATLIIQNGAQVNARGSGGSTPLHMAVSNDHASTAKLLIDEGALVNASNDYDQTPLVSASWKGNPEIVWLLVENGAEVNHAATFGNTILHNLAANGNVKSIHIVLDKGANANSIDEQGKLPLHNAVINRNADAIALLLKYTDNVNLQEDNLGNTPLHIAAINGDTKSSEILINAGADNEIKNNHGKTAVDYAAKYGYLDVVNYYVSKKLAPKQYLKLTKESQAIALQAMGTDEAKVVYCGHSGWMVETKNHVLIFDYWSETHTDNPSLVNGSINPAELKDKNVIVFTSHDHRDHYDPIIHSWADEIENIHYVYGFKTEDAWMYKKEKYQGPDYIHIPDNEQKEIDDVKVLTFKSTDSGQGFLVESDGITIYHPGDHAWFAEEDESPFKKEVDFVAGQTADIDIAFLPVTGCPSRWKKEFVQAGFLYTLDKLNPDQLYPMHALQREYTMKEFAELADENQTQSQVVCTENIGDNYVFNKSVVAAK